MRQKELIIKALTFFPKTFFRSTLAVAVMMFAGSFASSVAASDTKALSQVDTDGDGVSDVIENRHGLDPNKPYDVWRDNDEDHLPNIQEYLLGLDINSKDNDVFNNRQLMAQGAVVDIQSKIASKKQIVKLLANNATPVEVYNQLLDEKHFANMGFIGRVYQAVLYRQPDLDGARYYHHMLLQGMSKLHMVEQFLSSREFEKTYGELSVENFIDLAHLNIVGQAPETEDFDFFVDLMRNQGLTRAQLVLVFIDSSDYVEAWDWQKRVDVLSLLLTGQVPDSDQNQLYRQWLAEEQSAKSVLKAMLSSEGFRQNRTGLSASLDSDNDGKVDGVEFAEGTDIDGKDNDVLGDDEAFVSQVLRDIAGTQFSNYELYRQLKLLNKAGDRQLWLFNLIAQYGLNDARELAEKLLPGQSAAIDKLSGGNDVELIEQVIQSEAFQSRFY